MPVTYKPQKSALSNLVPHQWRKAIREYRHTLRTLRKKGLTYGDILDQVPPETRQYMLKMHQLQLIVWMVDNERMSLEDFRKHVNPDATLLGCE